MFKLATTLTSKALLVFSASVLVFHSSVFALSGNGTEANPYLITSLTDFDEFAGNSSYWDDYIRLDCNIDLSGQSFDKAIIAPDTSSSDYFQGTPFSGTFDGNGYIISNMVIDTGTSPTDDIGLFGFIVSPGRVQDLTINNFTISSNCDSTTNGSDYMGGLCGESTGTISNCSVSGELFGNYCRYVGGIVGQNSEGLIADSDAYIGITVGNDSPYVGGIAGVNVAVSSNSSIERCYAVGSILAGDSSKIGGLAGTNIVLSAGGYSTISYSYAQVTIVGGDNCYTIGGLVGWNSDSGAGIGNCFATGDVSGGSNSEIIGGLCGYNDEGFVFDSYSIGDVSGYYYVGGFCGVSANYSALYNCFSTGYIRGTYYDYGFCGHNGTGSEMLNCFWDLNTSGKSTGYRKASDSGLVDNVVSKTTYQMYDPNTFLDAGWDYIGETANGSDDNWRIPYYNGYPILSWQKDIPGDVTSEYGVNITDFSVLACQWLMEQKNGYFAQKKYIAANHLASIDYFGRSVAISGNIAIVGADGDDDAGSMSGSAYLFDIITGNQIAKLTASDAAESDYFGSSVAISGDIAIVGADGDDDNGNSSGSAYLFDVITGNQIAKLTASDAAESDYFGSSVAISGNVAVVGAWANDDAGISSGSAYLFNVTTGTQIAKLTASDAAGYDYFGRSVAIDGDIAIIGANGDDDAGSSSGSAYLFDVTTGTQLLKLTASDASSGDFFGNAVAIDDNYAIVGAEHYGGFYSGSAYVFDIITGNQIAKLTASDAANYDYFGNSVAIEGNYAIAGAYGNDDPEIDSGSAYVFEIGTGNQIMKITNPEVSTLSDAFGISVATDSKFTIVGSTGCDEYDTNAGAAFVYDNLAGKHTGILKSSDISENDSFGCSVSIDGDLAIVGACCNDDGGPSSGSAYIFDVTTCNQVHKLTASDATANDNFGWAIDISDNIAIVGAYGDDDNGSNSGSAYLFDAITGNQLFKLTASDAAENDEFGYSVAIDGDIAIIGANGDDDAGSSSGSAYLFDVTTGTQILKLTASDASSGDFFGISVDIDSDIAIVGAYSDDHAGSMSGSAYLFDVVTGNQLHKLTASDASVDHYFGKSVAIKENIAIVGAYYDNEAGNAAGAAYLFDTSTGKEILKLKAVNGSDSDYFGYSVAISNNVAAIGAPNKERAEGHLSGSVYLFEAKALKSDISRNGKVDLEDIAIICQHWLEGVSIDTAPPTPSPATFSTLPSAVNATEIIMTATVGSDESGPVEYYFAEISGNAGGDDRDWDTSPTYIDSGLDPNTQYTYTVQMRDAAGNVGTASDPESATTMEEGQQPLGLISYYKLDGTSTTIIDEMGVNNGTSNGATGDVEGKVGTAYSFDGVNDDISLSSPALPTTENADYSITVWIYLNSYDTSNGSCIFSQYLPSAVGRYWLTVDNAGKLNVDGTAKSTSQVPLNQWVFIAATRENGTVKGYINGDQDGSGTDTTAILDADGYIGNFDSSSNDAYCWDGKIDEVKIWNRALSAAEILSLHENP